MIDDIQTMTLLNVLEYDGLVAIEAGVAKPTERFERSLAAAATGAATRSAKGQKSSHVDLREPISQAMHALYGKYLNEEEMQRLVDAMLPIAAAR
jgi:hypothetical protein